MSAAKNNVYRCVENRTDRVYPGVGKTAFSARIRQVSPDWNNSIFHRTSGRRGSCWEAGRNPAYREPVKQAGTRSRSGAAASFLLYVTQSDFYYLHLMNVYVILFRMSKKQPESLHIFKWFEKR